MDALSLRPLPAKPARVQRPRRVLIIDDDDCVCTAIQAVLVRRNNETVLAARACDGIQAFESSMFDVVVVDLFMPGMNGLDIITHIRRISTVPIIAMSGFRLRNSLNAADHLSMAMDRGASAFLRKPFTSPTLFEVIDRSLVPPDTFGI